VYTRVANSGELQFHTLSEPSVEDIHAIARRTAERIPPPIFLQRHDSTSERMKDPIASLAKSGWNRCDSIRDGLKQAGLPLPTAKYLEATFSKAFWKRAGRAVEALQARFSDARFADSCEFGLLLVPDVAKLDTRGPVPAALRRDQSADPLSDLIDRRMGKGKLVTEPGVAWSIVATVTSSAGVFFGSYDDIVQAGAERFTADGVDTRALMVRQLWGARVLQSGDDLPDSTVQDVWTFTLFPGEGVTSRAASSGTILHGKVRFRLGRSDRRISSARVCPALLIER
jgi:hypothetical protein